MEVKLSVYFINHLDKKIKIDSNIVDINDAILEKDMNKLYNSLTFVTNNIYYDTSIVGDLSERIEVRYKVDDGIEVVEKFVIDNISYLQNNNIRINCKSITIRYSYKYAGAIDKSFQASTLHELLGMLLPHSNLDTTNLFNYPLIFDYEVKNKSIEEAIIEIQKFTKFDYYLNDDIIVFEDKKTIKEDDVSVKRFTALEDIISLNTRTNTDKKKINKILINSKKEEFLTASPLITLEIKDSPQCCSPDEVQLFEDGNNTFKISPVNAYYLVYYSPTIQEPVINMEVLTGDRIVIENYKLEKDESVTLVGGIDELLGIDGVENYTFEQGVNLITFDYVEKGELKITYKTKVLYGSIKHSKFPKNININIKHFNQQLDYVHKIEFKGYYAIPHILKINLVSDWGIDYNDAINGTVKVSKREDGAFVEYTDLDVDVFAETDFEITEYGTYKLERDEQEPLFLDWYVNSKKNYMHEVQ